MSETEPKSALDHFNNAAESYELSTGGCTKQLADHVVSLVQDRKPITSESAILDNACGTGIVTDILVKSERVAQLQPRIDAVDGAENMIRIAKARFPSYPQFHPAIMPGETLSFPDDTFTHSITNLGLMFFDDADQGAKEIVRTLKPGGVAVVTGWADLGYMRIIQGVQRQIRPEEPIFDIPLPKIWFEPPHTSAVLEKAGFKDVEASEICVHFGAETADGVTELLMKSWAQAVFGSWSEDEKKKAEELLKEAVKEAVVPFSRRDGSGVGIPMKATVFVGRKADTA